MTESLCCQYITSSTGTQSPFAKMICFGWYDGPTEGVILCERCSASYRFEMVAADVGKYDYSSWDRGEEIRIFTLAELPTGAWEQFVALLSQTVTPTWPVWYWNSTDKFSSADAEKDFIQKLHRIFHHSSPPTLVVAAHNFGLHKEIVRAKDLATNDIASFQYEDWFSYLEFS